MLDTSIPQLKLLPQGWVSYILWLDTITRLGTVASSVTGYLSWARYVYQKAAWVALGTV